MKIKKFNRKGYEQRVYLVEREIFKIDCTCVDFTQRRIKAFNPCSKAQIEINGEEKSAQTLYFAEPCKHLKDIVKLYEQNGYKLRRPKKMEGPDKLTAQVKNKVIVRSQGLCENTNCQNEAQCFHRKLRGVNGGKYIESNVVHICESCHKKAHSNEFGSSKSQ